MAQLRPDPSFYPSPKMAMGAAPEKNHDDLMKVLDDLLSEAGLSRTDLKGKVTFAGLDPIRPTVLKVGAGGAAVGAANSIASALLHQEKTGQGQDIHVDLRKAWAIHSKWQDIALDSCTVNGRSYLAQMSKFGERSNCHFLPTRDKRWIMVDANYPSQMLKMCLVFNSGYNDADELSAIRDGAMSFDELLAAATGLQESMEKAAAMTTLPADVDRDGLDDLLLALLQEGSS